MLAEESIIMNGNAANRDDAITEAGNLLLASGAVTQAYVDAMHEREKSVSTAMGNLLAIPHGTNEAKGEIRRTAISFVRYPGGLDWKGKEVKFVVGIAGAGKDHLPLLARSPRCSRTRTRSPSSRRRSPSPTYAVLGGVTAGASRNRWATTGHGPRTVRRAPRRTPGPAPRLAWPVAPHAVRQAPRNAPTGRGAAPPSAGPPSPDAEEHRGHTATSGPVSRGSGPGTVQPAWTEGPPFRPWRRNSSSDQGGVQPDLLDRDRAVAVQVELAMCLVDSPAGLGEEAPQRVVGGHHPGHGPGEPVGAQGVDGGLLQPRTVALARSPGRTVKSDSSPSVIGSRSGSEAGATIANPTSRLRSRATKTRCRASFRLVEHACQAANSSGAKHLGGEQVGVHLPPGGRLDRGDALRRHRPTRPARRRRRWHGRALMPSTSPGRRSLRVGAWRSQSRRECLRVRAVTTATGAPRLVIEEDAATRACSRPRRGHTRSNASLRLHRRRRSASRSTGERERDWSLHQGLLPQRPGRHDGVSRQQSSSPSTAPCPAGDRLRRPLPGPSLRLRHPARGDDGGLRRRRAQRQGASTSA